MLETQIAQQASSTSRQQGTLPGKPDVNPREEAYAVTLRNGKEYEGPTMLEEEEQSQPQKKTQDAPPPSNETVAPTKMDAPASEKQQQTGNSIPSKVKLTETPRYIPPHRFLPFSQRLAKTKLDQQFANFVDHLKKLNITIPITEAISEMPNFSKFLKDILTKKRNIEDSESVVLNEKCSTIFSSSLPPKLKDPGSFLIPCSIDTINIENAMCDLGASVSIMPKSVYDKLESGNLVPTDMTLTLADGTERSPLGILKNVVVKIGKIKIPADFVVVETYAQSTVLLGRALLATAGANIKVKEGELSFSVGKKKEKFHKPLKPPNKNSVCMIEISQVNKEFAQEKSVATSETDKSRDVDKTKQTWIKEKFMKLTKKLKNRSKKKFKEKDDPIGEKEGVRLADPQPPQ